MRGSRPRVYLAGPITGLAYAGATDWRDGVTAAFAPRIVGVSPMRGKAFLERAGVIGGTSREAYTAHVIASAKGVTTRDRWDTRTVDAVLMNVAGAERVSIGTMIEAGWADAFRVPVVLVRGPEDSVHDHMMLDEIAGYIVPTLDEAVVLVQALFS